MDENINEIYIQQVLGQSYKFYKKAQNAYLSLAKKKKNYLVFDSSKNTPELEKKIFDIVLDNIK